MGAFFSPDSKFMQAMARIADLVILNLLFLVSCIPLVTIGAASAALYTVCFRFGTDREQGVCRSYFRAFRE
ncbi:MAG: YesL family protein, partial [Clostridiales bacterium]|nr:YesL family protein [Clostridiales bacterium]